MCSYVAIVLATSNGNRLLCYEKDTMISIIYLYVFSMKAIAFTLNLLKQINFKEKGDLNRRSTKLYLRFL